MGSSSYTVCTYYNCSVFVDRTWVLKYVPVPVTHTYIHILIDFLFFVEPLLDQVPMCVDASKETIHSLVELLLKRKDVLLNQHGVSSQAEGSERLESGRLDASELDAAVVLSAVNVLTCQVFQLLSGSTPAAVRHEKQHRYGGRFWKVLEA